MGNDHSDSFPPSAFMEHAGPALLTVPFLAKGLVFVVRSGGRKGWVGRAADGWYLHTGAVR